MATAFEIVPNKNGKASVWAHFGFVKEGDSVDKKKVACRICNFVLRHSGNTTNLTDHLRRKHPTFTTSETRGTHKSKVPVSAPALPAAEGTIANIFGAKLASTSQRAKSITAAITQFIVRDLRPYSVVQNEGFRNLVRVMDPKYTLPSRQHFSEKEVPQLYLDVASQVKDALKGNYVALTTDGWTSRATQSYITITSVHINSDWKVQNFVLQVYFFIKIAADKSTNKRVSRLRCGT